MPSLTALNEASKTVTALNEKSNLATFPGATLFPGATTYPGNLSLALTYKDEV